MNGKFLWQSFFCSFFFFFLLWMFRNSKYHCCRVFLDICQMLCAYVNRCCCWWWRFIFSKIPYPTTQKEKKKEKERNIQQTRQINENMSHTWICSLLDGHASSTVCFALFSFFVFFLFLHTIVNSNFTVLSTAFHSHFWFCGISSLFYLRIGLMLFYPLLLYHHRIGMFGVNSLLF